VAIARKEDIVNVVKIPAIVPKIIMNLYNQYRRQVLSGSVDEIGKDLQEIKNIGVNHAILNYNRSSISNSIDDIIDVSKRISVFIR
jgi:hypothetical protein